MEYTLERKSIKNIYLRVLPDNSIHVSAPKRMSKRQIDLFVTGKEGWIRAQQEKNRSARGAWEQSGLTMPDRETLRQSLAEKIPLYLAKWEPLMDVHANEWRIRDMKTRWGTCNTREKRIWISQALGAYPDEFLEYVIVHELCHLLEPSHNAVFKGYMSRFLPDWKERKALLNELATGQKNALNGS